MPDIATPASSPARSSTWIELTVVPSDWASFAWASTVARPERTMAMPEAAAAATAAAVAIFTRAENAASRALAASISRPSRPKPRVPAVPTPSSSARTSRPPTTASRTLTRFSVISLPLVGRCKVQAGVAGAVGLMLERTLASGRTWARRVRRDVRALWIAARDPRTPWYAKLLAGAVVAYALSPIDLIPDVVPVLGYLDDLVLLPLGILLAVRLIPGPLMAEYRAAAAALDERPASVTGLVFVIAAWLCLSGLALWWLFPEVFRARAPR